MSEGEAAGLDEREERRLLALVASAGCGIALLATGISALVLTPNVVHALAASGAAAIGGVTALLVRARRVRAASWVNALAWSAVVLGCCVFDGGVRSAAAPAYLCVIGIAATLLGPRAALGFAASGALAFVGLEVLDRRGALPPVSYAPGQGLVFALVGDTVILGGLLALATSRVRRALAAARTHARDAERGRAQLERRARLQATAAALGQAALTLPCDALCARVADELAGTLDLTLVELFERGPSGLARRAHAGEGLDPEEIEGLVLRAMDAEHPLDEERRGLRARCVRLHDERGPLGAIVTAAPVERALDEDAPSFLDAIAALLSASLARERAQAALAEKEAQLLQAAKMDAIGKLAGGVAHDFNNLMTAVLSYATLIADRAPDASVREDARQIASAAERGASLTKQLLAFSRRQVLRARVLDPNDVISDLEKILRRLIGERVELVIRLGPPGRCVEVDPVQLQQVLLNLAINAREAMPRGGTLELSTAVGVDASDVVTIHVRDTGTGIPPSVLARVFEPFFTTKADGTGLGLATVYGIVKQSGGDVHVESAVGAGTTFRVCLPRVAAPARSALRSAPDTVDDVARRVLVVDDDVSVLHAVARVVRGAGHDVTAVSSPEEALALAATKAYDLVLCDVAMPGVSGPDLVRRVRATSATRCVLMSAYVGDDLAAQDLPADVALLSKPFTVAELRAVLAPPVQRVAESQ